MSFEKRWVADNYQLANDLQPNSGQNVLWPFVRLESSSRPFQPLNAFGEEFWILSPYKPMGARGGAYLDPGGSVGRIYVWDH